MAWKIFASFLGVVLYREHEVSAEPVLRLW